MPKIAASKVIWAIRVMGKQTIAESVWTAEMLAPLRDLEIDYAQGFAIAIPEPIEPVLCSLESPELETDARNGTSPLPLTTAAP